MKKLLAFAALFAVVALTSCKYDDMKIVFTELTVLVLVTA